MILRISIILIFLVHISFFAFGQSQDWKQIVSPFESSIYIVYQTNKGYLFGRMSETNQLFFSIDRGQTWSELTQHISNHRNGGLMIREDMEGNVFHAGGGGIYQLDPISLVSLRIIIRSDFLDFAILKNGNFIVADPKRLTIYSGHDSVLIQHDWWTHSGLLLLDQEGQKHYVIKSLGSSHKLAEFNDDLSFVGEDVDINAREMIRNGQKFFWGKFYSDDGIIWQSLNFPANMNISFMNSGHNGSLFFVSGEELFISQDNGMTLTSVDLPIINPSYVSSDLSGEIVITRENLHSPVFYLSNDMGLNWDLVIHEFGIPYMTAFSAGINENLYHVNDLNLSQLFYKQTAWSGWEHTNHPDGNRFSRIRNLSDGTIISISQSGHIHETKNNGIDWQLLTDHKLAFSSISGISLEEKSGILYSLYNDKMNYSEDFGRNWKSIQHTDTSLLLLFLPQVILAPNFGVYYFTNDILEPHKLIYYNFLTKEKTINSAVPNFYNLVASYSEETLYGMGLHQGILALFISKDHGATFTNKKINGLITHSSRSIKIDHLNNIYVYTDKQVFYSFNEGTSWINITPDFPEIQGINDLQVSFDNYIYVSTKGKGILKFKNQIVIPKTLSISVMNDQNKNCLADDNEIPLHNVNILVNGISLRAPDEQGIAIFTVNSLINEVKVIYNPNLYEECESFYTVEFEANDTEMHLNIPLKISEYCASPVIGLSVPFLRRCFDNTYHGSVCNEGNIESINTEIEIILDPSFDFVSASLPVKSLTGHILVLDADYLQPGECRSFNLVVYVDCNSEPGQEHCISATAKTRSFNCEDIETKVAYVECQKNIDDYNSNDKNIFVNGNCNQSYIGHGDKIEYLIRFQNTGKDTAITVRIEDPITKKFNISSLKPVAASHDYTWSVNNGMLVVIFEDIQLVDSFKNEPASHGFIKFEIQLDSLTLRGDDVKNLAGIFFDFNDPIITDEVMTIIGQPLKTKDHSFESITAFPNPANGLVYISGDALSDKPQDLMIYNIHGKLILSQKISYYSNSIDISKVAPGTYLLMMKSGEKVFRGKLVKM